MRYTHTIVHLLILFAILFVGTGCRPEGSSSHSPPAKKEKDTLTAEVTVGGKVWNINPDLSYRATGVWTNPNPHPLTDAEKERIQTIKADIETLQTQLNELETELRYLERIEKPQIKIHYRFGKPPYPVPKPSDFSSDNLIDLGEFSMEMDLPAKCHQKNRRGYCLNKDVCGFHFLSFIV